MKRENGKKEILERFSKNLRLKGIRSIQNYLSDVRGFFIWCEENRTDFLTLSFDEAQKWFLSLLSKEPAYSRGTVNNKLIHLKAFYFFLLKNHLILNDPFTYLRSLKTGRTLPKNILKPDQMDRLLSCFPEMSENDLMIKTLMELLYSSALRISEAEGIKVSDIDFISRSLIIYEPKTQFRRKVPLTECSAKLLIRYLNQKKVETGFVFPQGKTTTLRCHLNGRLKSYCKRLDLPVLTSHSFRHSAATHLLKNGAGIRQVQSFLGHAAISSTQKYTRIEKDDLKAAVRNYHPREALNHD